MEKRRDIAQYLMMAAEYMMTGGRSQDTGDVKFAGFNEILLEFHRY
jgi:hypothetical protein